MKKNILILVQSPSDIQYALDLYLKFQDTHEITIICINVRNMLTYLNTLNLNNCKIFLICYPDISFYQPIDLIKSYLQLKKSILKIINPVQWEKVYFFSVWYDWVGFKIVKSLIGQSEIYLIKHYKGVDELILKINNLKQKLKLILFSILADSKLYYTNNGGRNVLFFPYTNFNIIPISEYIVPYSTYLSFSYYDKFWNSEYILFIDNGEIDFIRDYNIDLVKIFKLLKSKNYKILVKGHPRLGVSQCVLSFIDFVIPSFVPAEFIRIDLIKFTFGIFSKALATLSLKNDNVYSIINEMQFKSEQLKYIYIDYLNDNSDGHLKFDSIENLVHEH